VPPYISAPLLWVGERSAWGDSSVVTVRFVARGKAHTRQCDASVVGDAAAGSVLTDSASTDPAQLHIKDALFRLGTRLRNLLSNSGLR
jgi:hypothetical protein